MNTKIEELITNMRSKPGMYIGYPSLERFYMFLCGFNYGMFKYEGEFTSLLPGFQEFVQEKYKIHSLDKPHWTNIIRSYTTNDISAFHSFFKLYDEFMEKKTK